MKHSEYIEKRNAIIAKLEGFHAAHDQENFVATERELEGHEAEWQKVNQVEERNSRLETIKAQGAKPARQPIPPANRGDEDVDPLGTKEYRNAVCEWLAGRGETRSINLLSGTEGAFARAPRQFDEEVITPPEKRGGLMGKIDLTITDGIIGTSGVSISARSAGFIKGEEIDLDNDAEAVLTFAERKLGSFPFTTWKAVTNSWLAGTIIKDPLSWLAGQMQIVKNEKESTLVLYGTGDNEPLGILVADSQGISSDRHIDEGSASGKVTYAQLLAMYYKVKPVYREAPGCEWNFCTDAMKQIDGLTDANGAPLVQELQLSGKFSRTFKGIPIVENELITTTATNGAFSDDTLVGFLGDLKMYKAVQPRVSGLQSSTHRLFEKNKTLVKLLTYLDGGCADETAFAVCKIAA